MTSDFEQRILPYLICPRCKSALQMSGGAGLCCSNSNCPANQQAYPVAQNQPVLIDFEYSLFKRDSFANNETGEVVFRKKGNFSKQIKRFLWGDSPVSAKQIDKLLEKLAQKKSSSNLLVVGGGTIGLGTEKIYQSKDLNVISFDVYITANTHFVADAHQIPVSDSSMDAVIVQAVLEHVLEPAKVVAEIFRVLKPGGIVYAETPFMQQVHEGAYDFTRYTESGHRWLFRDFTLIDSGTVRGVGVSLIWSLRYFFSGLFRSKAVGTAVAALFFWLRFVERLVPPKANIDGGSCFYFLGKKSNHVIAQQELIDFYGRK